MWNRGVSHSGNFTYTPPHSPHSLFFLLPGSPRGKETSSLPGRRFLAWSIFSFSLFLFLSLSLSLSAACLLTFNLYATYFCIWAGGSGLPACQPASHAEGHGVACELKPRPQKRGKVGYIGVGSYEPKVLRPTEAVHCIPGSVEVRGPGRAPAWVNKNPGLNSGFDASAWPTAPPRLRAEDLARQRATWAVRITPKMVHGGAVQCATNGTLLEARLKNICRVDRPPGRWEQQALWHQRQGGTPGADEHPPQFVINAASSEMKQSK
jgi:hypothetical protein